MGTKYEKSGAYVNSSHYNRKAITISAIAVEIRF